MRGTNMQNEIESQMPLITARPRHRNARNAIEKNQSVNRARRTQRSCAREQ